MSATTIQIGPHRVTITAEIDQYAAYILDDLMMARRRPGQGYRARADRTLAKVSKALAEQSPGLHLDRAQTLRFVSRLVQMEMRAIRQGK